jgi:hypothetical protein
MKIDIRFKDGPHQAFYVRGNKDVDEGEIKAEGEKIIEAEQLIERLTGLRVHFTEVDY